MVTFGDLVQLEPRLGDLAREVSAPYLARGQNHVRVAWHGYFKHKLQEIIRSARKQHPEFSEPASYDLCYQVILKALKSGKEPEPRSMAGRSR